MYFTYFVGVNFICIVTVERYFAICRPLRQRLFRGRSQARSTSLICWILGFILAVTGLAPYEEITICAEDSNGTWLVLQTCVPTCPWCFHLLVFYDTAQFLIVFVINTLAYVAIIGKLRKRASDSIMRSTVSTQQVSKDVTRMLLINGVAYFLLLGPYQIWNIALLTHTYFGVWIVSQHTFFLLGWLSRACSPLNFALNPLIYGSTNPRYRKAFLQVFGCSVFKENKREINSSYAKERTESRFDNSSRIDSSM